VSGGNRLFLRENRFKLKGLFLESDLFSKGMVVPQEQLCRLPNNEGLVCRRALRNRAFFQKGTSQLRVPRCDC